MVHEKHGDHMKSGFPANIFLFIICGASLLLASPAINDNIDDPNAIVYMNNDEGYQMDLVWSYYSGQKRGSYQMDLDYGLEMVYLSDLARLVFSKFINFTPGTFVLILRWIHLLGWIGAMIALWFLVGYNFGRGWKQILAVSLLWSRPAFNYFQIGLKPDPLALLFVIVGLYFVLKTIEKPSLKYIAAGMACAAIGLVIKFVGIFLLPAMIAALYFSNRRNDLPAGIATLTGPIERYPWIFPMAISVPFIISPFWAIFSYVRKATGYTYYEEFGLWQSILSHNAIFIFWFIAVMLIAFSAMLFCLGKSKRPVVVKTMLTINRVNACSVVTASLFSIFVAIFGFRWFSIPDKFLETYALHFVKISGIANSAHVTGMRDFFNLFFQKVSSKLLSFSVPLALLFLIYLWVELYCYRKGVKADRISFHKRMALLIFVLPIFPLLLNVGRLEQLHMLPLLIGVFLLSIEGASMFGKTIIKNAALKKAGLIIITALFITDITQNAAAMIKMRLNAFRQDEDVAFDIGRYFQKNVPHDKHILTDHYTRIYIPPLYNNLTIIPWTENDNAKKLRELFDKEAPEIIYYNDIANDGEKMPPLEELLPKNKIKLLKVFDQKPGPCHRYPGSRFFIYEVLK